MKIELVNPPRTFIDPSEVAPPLGLMRLAAAARRSGLEAGITDLNLQCHLDGRLAGKDTFYDEALSRLLDARADVYGFTSMVVDSHVAIHLAKLVKERRPEAKVILGGTHFGSIAEAVAERYPWIDVVVRGEAEGVMRRLPTLLAGAASGMVVEGSADDSERGELIWDFIDTREYFAVNENRTLDFESGRGCRFKCSFCYSPQQYKGFRGFSIEESVAELERARTLGFGNVFFVEDNFINEPERAKALCAEIERADLGLTWQAYVTFPQLDSKVISAMARAGCTAVFAGIDAVGIESRRLYKKAFVRDLTALEEKITECVEAGIIPTCAFLLSPPSYPGAADVDETVFFALAARNAGAQIRLNTLTLYNQTQLRGGTPVEYDNFKTRVMLDVPEVVEENPYAVTDPELFPFHCRYVAAEEWHRFVASVHCLYTLMEVFPKTLDSLWREDRGTPRAVAGKVLEKMGPFLEVPKIERRTAELEAAIEVLEILVTGNPRIGNVLERESGDFLNACEAIGGTYAQSH